MRFLLAIRNLSKGIYKGIRKEVQVLADISNLNSLLKMRTNEIHSLYFELGEYMYVMREHLDEEHIMKLHGVIDALQQEISQYQQQMNKLKDG